jgi:hypothetical protein
MPALKQAMAAYQKLDSAPMSAQMHLAAAISILEQQVAYSDWSSEEAALLDECRGLPR